MANIETSTDASRVLYLDSARATNNLSGVATAGESRRTTDVGFQLQEPIVVPSHHTILLSVHSCNIPYSFYNFQSGRNLTITYRETEWNVDGGDGSGTQFTLKEGNYNIQNLLNEISTEINSSVGGGSDFVVQFNPSTLKCEWIYKRDGYRLTLQFRADQTTNFKEEIGFAPNSFVAGLDTPATEDGTGYNFWMSFKTDTYRIGYSDGSTSTTITSTTSTDPIPDPQSYFSVIDVNYHIRQLYLRTNITSHSVLDSALGCRFSNILAKIPITSQSGGELVIAPTDGAVHTLMLKVREITAILVRLTDKDNKLINLNGLDFTIALQFDFVETPTHTVPVGMREKVDAKQYHNWLKSQGKSKETELKAFLKRDENKKFISV